MGDIYLITNQINNKVYVGKTIYNYMYRWKQHQQEASNHTNRKLYNAMNKYGIENFKIQLIETNIEDSLNEREQYWIEFYNSYNNGYNMTKGGDGLTKYIINEEYLRNLWDCGLSIGIISEELQIPIPIVRAHLTNYKNYSGHESIIRSSGKPVYQYDVIGNFIKAWPCASVAQKYYSEKGKDNIAATCRGEQRTSYGYVWRYDYVEKGNDIHNEKFLTIPIDQYDKNGNFIMRHDSLRDALKYMKNNFNYKRIHIEDVCKRKPCYNTAGGYVWRYYWDSFN